MTTINSQEDFLRALDENPQWLEAVRSRILDDELRQLPARFNAFVERTEAFMERTEAFVERTEAFMERTEAFVERTEAFMERTEAFMLQMQRFVEEQTAINTRLIQRMDRLEGDFSGFKGEYARMLAVRDAQGMAEDMGLEYVRTLSMDELAQLARNSLDRESLRERRDQLRSFRRADLIMETKDGATIKYVAIEISFTADHRETDRAERNAELLTEFTGAPAVPAVASFRNDKYVERQVERGDVFWHPLEDRTPRPE
jgi:ElaB/YqjD/DUF883 family membrane-anchored ribosome-binding protein